MVANIYIYCKSSLPQKPREITSNQNINSQVFIGIHYLMGSITSFSLTRCLTLNQVTYSSADGTGEIVVNTNVS